MGTPDNKRYYEKILQLSKNDKTIEIKPKVSNKELENILATSLAGIFLGYSEDFGIVPLEIIAAGKPLLAVDEGGYVKLIKNHPLFYKIKEKDSEYEMVKEISKKLEEFIKKPRKKITKKINLKDFIGEIDEGLEK